MVIATPLEPLEALFDMPRQAPPTLEPEIPPGTEELFVLPEPLPALPSPQVSFGVVPLSPTTASKKRAAIESIVPTSETSVTEGAKMGLDIAISARPPKKKRVENTSSSEVHEAIAFRFRNGRHKDLLQNPCRDERTGEVYSERLCPAFRNDWKRRQTEKVHGPYKHELTCSNRKQSKPRGRKAK